MPILRTFRHPDWRTDGLTMLGVPIYRPGDTGSARENLTALIGGFEASLYALGRLPAGLATNLFPEQKKPKTKKPRL